MSDQEKGARRPRRPLKTIEQSPTFIQDWAGQLREAEEILRKQIEREERVKPWKTPI